jgi:hypothetical protein
MRFGQAVRLQGIPEAIIQWHESPPAGRRRARCTSRHSHQG